MRGFECGEIAAQNLYWRYDLPSYATHGSCEFAMIDYQLLLKSNTASLIWRPSDHRYRPMQHPPRKVSLQCASYTIRPTDCIASKCYMLAGAIILAISVGRKMYLGLALPWVVSTDFGGEGHCRTLWTPFSLGLCHSPTRRSAPPPEAWDTISPEFMPRRHWTERPRASTRVYVWVVLLHSKTKEIAEPIQIRFLWWSITLKITNTRAYFSCVSVCAVNARSIYTRRY